MTTIPPGWEITQKPPARPTLPQTEVGKGSLAWNVDYHCKQKKKPRGQFTFFNCYHHFLDFDQLPP